MGTGSTSRHRRRGSIYIGVLLCAVIVTVIGLTALAAARVQRTAVAAGSDSIKARFAAESAVELAMEWIASDTGWRQDHPNGTWATNLGIGEGKCEIRVVDPGDADLADDDADPVVITGIGMSGGAVQKISVRMEAAPIPMDCLKFSAYSGGLQTHTGTNIGPAGQRIGSVLTITAVAATVNCDVVATAAVGLFFNGSVSIDLLGVPIPTAGNASSYYIANGTPINISSLPTSGSNRMIERCLISPNSNPFGGTLNARGIYIIDCGGSNVVIQSCRIVGTLLLLNPGAGSAVQSSVNWEPAEPGLPALVATGGFDIKITAASLSENSGGTNVNFNPSGTPYAGVSNTNTTDSYPSIIRGLVYISGSCNTSNAVTIDGLLLVRGALSTTGSLTLANDFDVAGNPPPGFYTPLMKVTPGSWAQVVDP